jgi:hypothetical protein
MTQDESDPAPVRKPRSCRCGHDRTHHLVSAEGKYTFSGYLRLFFGISARPVKVEFHCRKCDKVFDVTTDPAVLDKHY